MSHNAQEQIEKLYEQFFNVVDQLVVRYQEVAEDDEDAIAGDMLANVTSLWEEAAEERGWNMAAAARAGRAVHDLCKSAGE